MDLETLEEALTNNDLVSVQRLLDEHPTHEIAAELLRLDPVLAGVAFRLLGKDRALAVFEEFDPRAQHEILGGLRDDSFHGLVESMDPDDRARLVGETPAKVTRRVLAGLSPSERFKTAALLGYPERSVGRYMTPEIVALHRGLTVNQALRRIRAKGAEAETVYTLPVVDDGRRLVGITTLRRLVLAEGDEFVDALMDEDFPEVYATDDAEAAARLVQDANLLALVVVDSEERLVGILTVDDAVELIEEADTEDVARQSGASPLSGHYLTAGVFQVARSRATWLLLLLFAAVLTVNVLDYFEGMLAEVTQLALFIPFLVGAGGNAGAQAATTAVRAIAVGEVRARDVVRVAWREVRVGFNLGLMLGVVALGIAAVFVDWPVAATVAIALVVICAWAAVVGAVMPLVAKRLRIDPAVISAPLVTTLVDATGLVIYFTTAYLLVLA